MELTELAVLDYVSRPPTRFVRPQCHLPFANGNGGSSPDLVVIDFGDQTVYVVEVSVRWNLTELIGKVQKRETLWYRALQDFGQQQNVAPLCWTNYRTALFVRGDRYEYVLNKVKDYSDVSVISLDRIIVQWEWEWTVKNTAVNSLNQHLEPRKAA